METFCEYHLVEGLPVDLAPLCGPTLVDKGEVAQRGRRVATMILSQNFVMRNELCLTPFPVGCRFHLISFAHPLQMINCGEMITAMMNQSYCPVEDAPRPEINTTLDGSLLSPFFNTETPQYLCCLEATK